jgi:putative ABC transport system substrate-binding protein
VKKTRIALAAGLLAALTLSACGTAAPTSQTTGESAEPTAAAPALSLSACGGSVGSGQIATNPIATPDTSIEHKMAITMIVEHPSLVKISDGFKDAISDAGVKVSYVEDSAQNDVANTTTIAGKYASDPDIEVILAIATPSAQAMVNAVSDRPILYAGVTDPVTAGITAAWGATGTNVSGTSDLNPNGCPLALVQEALGVEKVVKVGFPYTLTEQNSAVQLQQLQDEAEGTGVEIVPAGISSAAELTQALETLKSKGVSAIHIGTDNTIVNSVEQVIAFCQQNQIPLFSLDTDSVEKGTIAARGIDYYKLGRATGEMALQILGGTDVGTIAQLQVLDTQIVANPAAAASFGVELPAAFTEGAQLVES